MTLTKRRLLMSCYINSQFNHCPLVWMIHNRHLNKKINKVQERALRIVYGDHKTSFSELLNIDESVTMNQRNLQYLLIAMYKVKKGISPTIMNEISQFFENPVYELRSVVHLPSRNSPTLFFGTESMINLRTKLWDMVPEIIKSSDSFNVFKSKIKYWTLNHCPCRIFKTYIGQVCFINYIFESTINLTFLFFNDKILKILLNSLKVLNPFVLKIYLFIVPYNDCTI